VGVSTLGVAWTVPITATDAFGVYATMPVVAGGVVYTQDLVSNVEAIDFKTGKVIWTKKYNSTNNGPNGVTVANSSVFGATSDSAFALDATTGQQRVPLEERHEVSGNSRSQLWCSRGGRLHRWEQSGRRSMMSELEMSFDTPAWSVFTV
jgi:outer membrane protein assembly factor BamB